MARNLPLAFLELLGGGLLVTAAVTGHSLPAVVAGDVALDHVVSGGAGSSAGSSSIPGDFPAGPAGGVNPFKYAHALAVGRTDQGVDASMAPGSPIVAPWDSKLTNIQTGWYHGQSLMAFEILSGPHAGEFWYLAEQIVPHMRVGDKVRAGRPVATYASSGTGIEMGWAADASGRTLANATTGYTEGAETPAGDSFRKVLRELGVPV